MEIKDFSVLVVGCGSIGKRHAECLQVLGIRKFVFYDPDMTQSRMLAEQYQGKAVNSYEEGLEEDCNAVYILSPTSLHIAQAKAAVLKGKHVFIEKPLSTSPEGVEELEQLAAERDLVVMVGFCFRFHEGICELHRQYKAGRIGKLVAIRAMMGEHFPDVRPDYLSTYYVKYSGAFELVHDLDLALYFAEEMPTEYEGYFGSYAELGFESPDCVEFILKFSDKLANVHLDFFQTPRTRTFTLLGTQGQLVLDFASWDACTVRCFTRAENAWQTEHMETRRNDMFVAESENFFKTILGQEENRIPIREARKTLEIYQKILNSGKTREK